MRADLLAVEEAAYEEELAAERRGEAGVGGYEGRRAVGAPSRKCPYLDTINRSLFASERREKNASRGC